MPKQKENSPLRLQLHPVDDGKKHRHLQLTGPTQPTSNGHATTRNSSHPKSQLTSLITLAQKFNSKRNRHSSRRLDPFHSSFYRDSNGSISVSPFNAISPTSGTEARDHKTTQPLIKQIVSQSIPINELSSFVGSNHQSKQGESQSGASSQELA